jgi:hypothetical protein
MVGEVEAVYVHTTRLLFLIGVLGEQIGALMADGYEPLAGELAGLLRGEDAGSAQDIALLGATAPGDGAITDEIRLLAARIDAHAEVAHLAIPADIGLGPRCEVGYERFSEFGHGALLHPGAHHATIAVWVFCVVST